MEENRDSPAEDENQRDLWQLFDFVAEGATLS